MANPVLIELTRGAHVESMHAGCLAVARADGGLLAALGDVAAPVFPRSAIKPLQAVPFAASGALERFQYGVAETAIACGSHAGTPRHVAVVAAMLARAGLAPSALLCGVHEPMDAEAARALIRSGEQSTPLHHNCSGKHAAMLATAVQCGEPVAEYWQRTHPVQARIHRTLEELTRLRLGEDAYGIDGCSVPNWAMPLSALAAAYARFATGHGLPGAERAACQRLMQACWAAPLLVAGPGRLDTRVMLALPGEVVMKSGAEGVYCGALPQHGVGFAVKIDDGAKRAAEAVSVALIARLVPAAAALGPNPSLRNWRGLEVGRMRPSAALAATLATIG
jgi:L-asparaginase II